ncbi:MAG: heme NO-binding domain-containing protein [Pseudomonas sp.]|uniref:heme NO-binding domain-containing protein n=1 Tax=Pseudomonas sp. TaxID=306 RepID=UPI0027346486|nr:heme NO-binding domain-containing protein [Pseudomonas sp.]MDP3847485.1 heme NO-binding domain-containing protein [Pseudomonas sp.]
MKGMVFTEFLEMVETRFGLQTVDRIIGQAQLANDGAYTAVGTYDHQELVQLVTALSAATQVPVPDLIKAFGQHLFGRFALGYPRLFEGVDSAFAFLRSIERYIHVEVRKLYPDAELPSFTYERQGPDDLVMLYQSRRPFADLAEGLILGCIEHYGEAIDLRREDLETGATNRSRFTLTRRS